MADILGAAVTYVTLEQNAIEIALDNYLFLRRVPNTKKWLLKRRGHRAGGSVFISRHRNLYYAIKAYTRYREGK